MSKNIHDESCGLKFCMWSDQSMEMNFKLKNEKDASLSAQDKLFAFLCPSKIKQRVKNKCKI